jgi:hypothetical protein
MTKKIGYLYLSIGILFTLTAIILTIIIDNIISSLPQHLNFTGKNYLSISILLIVFGGGVFLTLGASYIIRSESLWVYIIIIALLIIILTFIVMSSFEPIGFVQVVE